MTGVAVIAMAAAAGAQAADNDNATPGPNLVLAQNMPRRLGGISNAELAARIQALEDEQPRRPIAPAPTAPVCRPWSRATTPPSGHSTTAAPPSPRGDGRFTLAIRARFQADYAGYHAGSDPDPRAGFAGPTDLSSGAVIRRAYFGIEGKAYSDFSYEIRLNAGGSERRQLRRRRGVRAHRAAKAIRCSTTR